MARLERFTRLLEEAEKIVGFTGAGVSTESGIPDYRSRGGVWERFTPVSLKEFVHDPAKRSLYWQRRKLLWESIRSARPNAALFAVEAVMERLDPFFRRLDLRSQTSC